MTVFVVTDVSVVVLFVPREVFVKVEMAVPMAEVVSLRQMVPELLQTVPMLASEVLEMREVEAIEPEVRESTLDGVPVLQQSVLETSLRFCLL